MATADAKVCLLSGASGVLGTAFCRLLASRYQIVGIWGNEPLAPSLADQRVVDLADASPGAEDGGTIIYGFHADVRDARQTAEVVDLALKRFGRIDVIINAAGFRGWSRILRGTPFLLGMDRHYLVNMRAPVALTIQVTRRFWVGRHDENIAVNRSVINVSSSASFRVYPGYGQAAYSASKAGLNLLTKHLASELEIQGVRANAIAPDSFPSIIPTDSVVDAIVLLADGTMSGHVLELEAQGAKWL